MGRRPPEHPAEQSTSVLARLTMATAEDPFGPGDPLEVARLVRRTLAVAGRKAAHVTDLVVATAVPVPTDALGRFARRALGPHGAAIASRVVPVAPHTPHGERIDVAAQVERSARSLTILVAIGPGQRITALCLSPPVA